MTSRRKYQRMEFKAPAHPSGRPISENRFVLRPIWRVPEDGPITPSLRPGRERTAAIGFTARLAADDDE